jgi:predicted Rdx family selenoprotein
MDGLAVVMLIVFMVMGLASVMTWKRYADRMSEFPKVARRAGLSYSEGDAFGSARVAFALFRLGDGREVTNTMWGTAPDGTAVRAFDYAYYTESYDNRGMNFGADGVRIGEKQRHYRHFTCALAEVPAVWPNLRITPQKGLTRLINAIDGADIDFESGEFNRMFRVTCEDERFAHTFIDAQMIQLLVSTKGEFEVEVRGRWILIAGKQQPPRGFPGMINLHNALRSVIPPLVWQTYPQGPRASLDGGFV